MLRPEINLSPFPHAILHPALDWDTYWMLHEAFPKPEQVIGDRKLEPNKLYQRHADSVVDSPDIEPVWQDFFREATSESTFETMSYGCIPTTGTIGMRYRDACDIALDCLFGINTPVERRGSVKGPHLDNPREIYACLIYFPVKGDAAGGDLGVYRYNRDKPRWFGQRMTHDVELVTTCPYKHNTAIWFANGPNSLHGVLPRDPTLLHRRYVNIEAEYARPLWVLP